MGVGPPEPACRGRLQTTASCAGTTAGVVSVAEKASRGGRQVRAGKANESEPLMTRREAKMMSKPRWSDDPWEKPGGYPAYCPGGVRRKGGASPVQAPVRNVGSCDPDTVPGRVLEPGLGGREGEAERRSRQARVPRRGMQWRTASW